MDRGVDWTAMSHRICTVLDTLHRLHTVSAREKGRRGLTVNGRAAQFLAGIIQDEAEQYYPGRDWGYVQRLTRSLLNTVRAQYRDFARAAAARGVTVEQLAAAAITEGVREHLETGRRLERNGGSRRQRSGKRGTTARPRF
jgi:hypothetical protein